MKLHGIWSPLRRKCPPQPSSAILSILASSNSHSQMFSWFVGWSATCAWNVGGSQPSSSTLPNMFVIEKWEWLSVVQKLNRNGGSTGHWFR
eukprot:5203759-Amphidinium_carterae.1